MWPRNVSSTFVTKLSVTHPGCKLCLVSIPARGLTCPPCYTLQIQIYINSTLLSKLLLPFSSSPWCSCCRRFPARAGWSWPYCWAPWFASGWPRSQPGRFRCPSVRCSSPWWPYRPRGTTGRKCWTVPWMMGQGEKESVKKACMRIEFLRVLMLVNLSYFNSSWTWLPHLQSLNSRFSFILRSLCG